MSGHVKEHVFMTEYFNPSHYKRFIERELREVREEAKWVQLSINFAYIYWLTGWSAMVTYLPLQRYLVLNLNICL